MEDILDLYELPYDCDLPILCMNEKPLSLHDHARTPIPMNGNHCRIEDSEYVRKGTCSIFMMCEPKAGIRHVSARAQRTAVDWAQEMRNLVLNHYGDYEKIIIICDNLNTHTIGSFYKAFEAAEARDIVRRLEFHYTPKHGSWLNIAECELNALTRQCLDRKMSSLEEVQKEIEAWCVDRNNAVKTVDWQFTTEDARTKLRHLYPILKKNDGTFACRN